MKAREPDRTGVVERDGVHVAWREYGDLPASGRPAVLLLPTWLIVTSEIWRFQVPFLARRSRVITFDPRGNGLSDRPRHRRAYRREELTRDAVDVLDATGTDRAVVVAFSAGNAPALDLAAELPERVAAWVAVAPSIDGLGTFPADREAAFDRWETDTHDDEGWGRYNRHSWLRDYRGFTEFFFGELVSEAHSTKLVEDYLGWSATTDAETLVRGQVAQGPGRHSLEDLCEAVRCQVVVVHGTDDRVIPYEHGVRLAELTGGSLETFVGSGHAPHGRDPVAFNRVLDGVLRDSTRAGSVSSPRR